MIARRRVQNLLSFTDPAGNHHEAFWGVVSDFAVFNSATGVSGFVTGDQGLGHIVLPAPNFDDTAAFFTDVLGFASYYTGPPVTAPSPVLSPIGIPTPLTTEVGYQAGIVYPTPGEYGRLEMIQVHGLRGEDYRERCRAPHLGILAVRFPAPDIDAIEARLRDRQLPLERFTEVAWPGGEWVDLLQTRSPDGGILQFFNIREQLR